MSSDLLKGLDASSAKKQQGYGGIQLNSPESLSTTAQSPQKFSPSKVQMSRPGVNNNSNTVMAGIQQFNADHTVSNPTLSPVTGVNTIQSQVKITQDTINEIRGALDIKNFALLKEIAVRGPDFKQLVDNLAQDFLAKNMSNQPSCSVKSTVVHMQTYSPSISVNANNVVQGQTVSPSQGQPVGTYVSHQMIPAKQVSSQKSTIEQRFRNAKSAADQMVKLASTFNKQSQQMIVQSNTDSSGHEDEVLLMDLGSPGRLKKTPVRQLSHLQPLVTSHQGQAVAMEQYQLLTAHSKAQQLDALGQVQTPKSCPQGNQQILNQVQTTVVSQQDHGQCQSGKRNTKGQILHTQNEVMAQQSALPVCQTGQAGTVQGVPMQQIVSQISGHPMQSLTSPSHQSSIEGVGSSDTITSETHQNMQENFFNKQGTVNSSCGNMYQTVTSHVQGQEQVILNRRVNNKKGRTKKVTHSTSSVDFGQQPVMSNINQANFTSQQQISVQNSIKGQSQLSNNMIDNQNVGNIRMEMQQNIQNNKNIQNTNLCHLQGNQFVQNVNTGNQLISHKIPSQDLIVDNQLQNPVCVSTSQICVNVPSKNLSQAEILKQVQIGLDNQGKNIKVLPAQRAQTQVINSTGTRQTAPRPRMAVTGTQHRLMTPRSSVAVNQSVRSMTPQNIQVRSDQYQSMRLGQNSGVQNIDATQLEGQTQYMTTSQRLQGVRTRVPINQQHMAQQMTAKQITTMQYQQLAKQQNVSSQGQIRSVMQSTGQHLVNTGITGIDGQVQVAMGNQLQMQQQGNIQLINGTQQIIGNQGNQMMTNSTQEGLMISNNMVHGNEQGILVQQGSHLQNMMVRQGGMQHHLHQQGVMMKSGGDSSANTQVQQSVMVGPRVVSAHQQQFLNTLQGNPGAQQRVTEHYTYSQDGQIINSNVPHQLQGQGTVMQHVTQQSPQQVLLSNTQLTVSSQQQHCTTNQLQGANQSQQQQQQMIQQQQMSPVSGNSNEPNILPLSPDNESSQNVTNVPGGAGNNSLVKGQEYLIQYSNGKKVIGIWDGKFFKVRGPGMSGTQETANEEQGGQVNAPTSSQQMSSAITSPDGTPMMGGGLVEKKLRGNATGMNLAGVAVSQSAGGDSNANWHNNIGNSTLARRPIHDDGQQGSVQQQTLLLEVKKAQKRPPRPREEGKYAVCKNCGAYSADYDNCDSCHKPIPEDAKLYQPEAGSMAKKPRVDPDNSNTEAMSPPQQKQAKVLVVQTGSQQVVIAQAQPKGVASARGRGGKAKGRGRGKNVKKSPEIETVTILSSDDESETAGTEGMTSEVTTPTTLAQQQPTSEQGTPSFFSSPAGSTIGTPLVPGNLVPIHKSGLRQRMEDESGKVIVPKHILQQQKRQQQAANQLARSQDLSSILVQLQSRSIRIGSYRGQPADHFKITVQGVQFTITWGEDCLQIHIGSNEITKVMCHLGESMPCMFLDTTPSCAQRLRQALEMEAGKEPFYDPQSHDEVHKKITVIFENLGELGIENYIRALFQVMQAGNPYFHKEGSLLEEIEYQDANQILINSTPQAQLQLLHLGLGGNFLGGDDDNEDEEPIDRSRSPSPARIFTGEIIKLFTYPPPPATGGITVTNEDLFCLNDGEFLNDVIIDFYLKYLYYKQSEEVQKKTHIFSSFFYRRLTSKQTKRNDDEQTMTIQQKRHSRVKTWTRHVDLFQKDFIIVPINESAHWYLAMICYPGLLEPEFSKESQQTTNSGNSTPASQKQPVTNKTAETKTPSPEKDLSDNTSEKNVLQEDQNSNMRGDEGMETDENSQGGLPQQQGKYCKQSCILIFDSLAGPSRSSVIRTLREYLQIEWDNKKKEKCGERVLDKDSIRGNSPKCPQQMNFSDCGVYVLQYVESFLEEPLKDFSIPIRGLEEWFSEETALSKREELRQLIVALQKQINPQLNYDPAQDGCMVGCLEEDDEEEEDLPNLLKLSATGISSSPSNATFSVKSPLTNSASSSQTKSNETENNVHPNNIAGPSSQPVQSKSTLTLQTANLTAEQIVAAVTKGEIKS